MTNGTCGPECASQEVRKVYSQNSDKWRAEAGKIYGGCDKENQPIPPTPSCPGKYDNNGSCNPACCNSDSQCSDGQKCNIPNGFCKSTTSCNPNKEAKFHTTCVGGACVKQACPDTGTCVDDCSSCSGGGTTTTGSTGTTAGDPTRCPGADNTWVDVGTISGNFLCCAANDNPENGKWGWATWGEDQKCIKGKPMSSGTSSSSSNTGAPAAKCFKYKNSDDCEMNCYDKHPNYSCGVLPEDGSRCCPPEANPTQTVPTAAPTNTIAPTLVPSSPTVQQRYPNSNTLTPSLSPTSTFTPTITGITTITPSPTVSPGPSAAPQGGGTLGINSCLVGGNRYDCSISASDSFSKTVDCSYSGWNGKYKYTPICQGKDQEYACKYMCWGETGTWEYCKGNPNIDYPALCDRSAGMQLSVSLTISNISELQKYYLSVDSVMVGLCKKIDDCYFKNLLIPANSGDYTDSTTYDVKTSETYEWVTGYMRDSKNNLYQDSQKINLKGSSMFPSGGYKLKISANKPT